MRSITCLRADDGGGYTLTYRVGETLAGGSAGEFVAKIEFVPAEGGYGLAAMVTFDTGLTRSIPEHRIIIGDLGELELSRLREGLDSLLFLLSNQPEAEYTHDPPDIAAVQDLLNGLNLVNGAFRPTGRDIGGEHPMTCRERATEAEAEEGKPEGACTEACPIQESGQPANSEAGEQATASGAVQMAQSLIAYMVVLKATRPSRELSCAFTHAEEALMWLERIAPTVAAE